MKSITLSFFLLFSVVNFAISQEKLEKLGLISELVYLKNSTENITIQILNDSTIQESTKIEFINSYNTLKTMSDQWILQLISDMSRKNSMKKFKRLDHALTEESIKTLTPTDYEKKKIKTYLENLKIIYKKHQELLSLSTEIVFAGNEDKMLKIMGFYPTTVSVEEITGVLTFITSTIATINENKKNKVEKISSILDSLRFKSLQEILKPEEKNE